MDSITTDARIRDLIDAGGGQACDIEGIIRELAAGGFAIVPIYAPTPLTPSDEMVDGLTTLKAFLENEARGHVKFVNDMQARRTADYKARGDTDADYRGLSGIEETKYWPFIKIIDHIQAALNLMGGKAAASDEELAGAGGMK